jgi:myo-inositol-1(or 4)-monophosphatase
MSAWAVSIAVVQAGNPVAAVIHAPAHRITLAAEVGQGIWVNDEPYIRTENLEPSIAFTGVSSNISSTVDKWLIGFVRDTLGLAERRLGSATIMLIETILGRGDLYIGFGEHPWDVYGGAIIGQELQLAHSIVWPSEISNHEMVFVLGRPSLVEHTLAALRFNCLIHD